MLGFLPRRRYNRRRVTAVAIKTIAMTDVMPTIAPVDRPDRMGFTTAIEVGVDVKVEVKVVVVAIDVKVEVEVGTVAIDLEAGGVVMIEGFDDGVGAQRAISEDSKATAIYCARKAYGVIIVPSTVPPYMTAFLPSFTVTQDGGAAMSKVTSDQSSP
jgi:hypothetical protein